jgi:hypothetical protein
MQFVKLKFILRLLQDGSGHHNLYQNFDEFFVISFCIILFLKDKFYH